MKKRNLYLILVVVVLGAIAVFLVARQQKSSIKPELRDFAVQDTASVDKIFMVDKANNEVLLTREGKHWMVNGKFAVRIDAIDILLKTLHRVRVKAPVSKSAMDNVLKMLATRNTKVEIYRHGKLTKTIYVGGPTQDQMGTFMMLEGSSAPFVVSVPGFVGYLSPRFFIEEKDWRSPNIFVYNFDDISAIESINNEDPDQSFKISQSKSKFSIESLNGEIKSVVMDTLAIKFFISNFERVASEFFIDDMEASLKDSLEAATPFRVLSVTDGDGETTTVEAYRRKPPVSTDPEEPVLEWDKERMYAKVNDSHWVVIQYFVFDLLFRDLKFFLPIKQG
ncbi:MAG: DUF4340 domain-containing protein [Bacteroidales bacterium]|nr:DUF4340 domain-containing protein [Bacteroidales bacterium]